MQLAQTMTAVRALLAGGMVAIAGGAVLLLSNSDLLYAVAAFGVIAAGILMVAVGATGYEWLKPADRKPLVGRRFGAILLIIFGLHALLWGVLGTWGMIVSGINLDARRPFAPLMLLVVAVSALAAAWIRLRGRTRNAKPSPTRREVWSFRRPSSIRTEVVLPSVPAGPMEVWARPNSLAGHADSRVSPSPHPPGAHPAR